MPYIPQFNRISLQESAYAPTLMRQQHDEAIAKSMELSDAMKFDYLKQDADKLEPVLQKYSQDIGKVSEDLAKSGFTQDTKSKILGLRSQFTGDDKIRHIKKNYADAMSQWDEQRKRMIQEGRPGDEINKQKNAFFSGYQGAFSDDGFKNDFTAGATSGTYKIGDYALKAADRLGHTGATINGGKDQLIPMKDNKTGDTYYEVRNVSDGKLITNISQVDAIKKYVTDQFNTKGTDENLYSKIVGLTPEYINSTVDNVLNSQIINDVTSPRSNSSFTGFTHGENPQQPTTLNEYENFKVDSEQYKQADDREKAITADTSTKQKNLDLSYGATWGAPKGDSSGSSQPGAYGKTSEQIKQENIDSQNKITPRYLQMTNPSTGSNYTPQEAALRGIKAIKNASAYKERSTAMNIDPNSLGGMTSAEVVIMNLINSSSETPLVQVGGKMFGGDKKMSKQDFINSIETTDNKGVSWKDAPVEFKNNGDILLKDFKGNTFKVNSVGDNGEGILEYGTGKLYNELYLPILNKLTAFDLHDNPILDAPIQGEDGYTYDVVSPKNADPYSTDKRMVRKSATLPDGKVYQEFISQSDFKQGFLKQAVPGVRNIQISQ